MEKFRALIVEDEKENSDLLIYFLKKFSPNLEVIGVGNTISDSLDLINSLKPQILFLDIKLQNESVIDLLNLINFGEYEIIFITAYDEFVFNSFKYNVVDYLLKPIVVEDLLVAINRAIFRIEEKKVFETKTLFNEKTKIQKRNFLTIFSLDKVQIIKKKEIIMCKSDGRYTTFFLKNNEEIVACKNIGEYELILDENFYRVHQSYIVNLNCIKTIHKKHGFYCEMINGANVPISKRNQETFSTFLK